MGVAGEIDTHSGIDANTVSGIIGYGWAVGVTGGGGGNPDHYEPNAPFSRVEYQAIITAAQGTEQDWRGYLTSHHPVQAAWLATQSPAVIHGLYIGDRGLRGL